MGNQVVNRISDMVGTVKGKVTTQNASEMIQSQINQIKRNADAVRGKGYASKKKKKKK